MPMYDYLYVTDTDHAAAANGNTYSTEINFGYAVPGVAAANRFGAHVVITQAYTAINSGMNLRVVTGSATTPTTKVVERFLSQTQLGVLGAHYFVPIPPNSLLQYTRLKHVCVSENATLGKMTTWLGPDGDGSI
jgi:hypothetical protein